MNDKGLHKTTSYARHQSLVPYWEGFNAPHHPVLFRNVFSVTCAGFKLGRVGVTRHRHTNLNIIGYRLLFKLSFSLEYRERESEDSHGESQSKLAEQC